MLLTVAACGSATSIQPAPSASIPHAVTASSVDIPGADRFAPFVTMVRNGSRVTFTNNDSDAHSVVTVPGAPSSFVRVLAPGENWTVTLASAGTYHYYCSIHAQYDAATGQVRALPKADHPDEPMEGVVIVA